MNLAYLIDDISIIDLIKSYWEKRHVHIRSHIRGVYLGDKYFIFYREKEVGNDICIAVGETEDYLFVVHDTPNNTTRIKEIIGEEAFFLLESLGRVHVDIPNRVQQFAYHASSLGDIYPILAQIYMHDPTLLR